MTSSRTSPQLNGSATRRRWDPGLAGASGSHGSFRVSYAPASIALFCALLFFQTLGARELISSHEARAAQNAQAMLDSGDWLLPRLFDGRVELQKPPLYYWLVALAGWANGGRVDAWSVRLPAALAGLGTVLLVYWLCAQRGRWLAGVFSAFILATCLHFSWLARVGRIDMPLTFAVTLALVAFANGDRRLRDNDGTRAWPWFLLAYVAVALGVLLKGPIAIVLPALVVAGYRIYQRVNHGIPTRQRGKRKDEGGRMKDEGGRVREQSKQQRLRPSALLHPSSFIPHPSSFIGLPLVVALTAPWFVWANNQTDGEFFRIFFWYHNVARGFGDGGGALQAHPWWFYGPRLAIDLLPWSLVLPIALWSVMRTKSWRHDAEIRLGLIWFGAVFLLLSVMRFKRADYLLPAYPGVALLLGCVAERWYRQAGSPRLWARSFSTAVALCLLGWIGYTTWYVPTHDVSPRYAAFASRVRACTGDAVIFFRTESHALAFHVGRPLHTLLEWENLDIWASRPRATYVIMPAECAAEWRRQLTLGTLEEVARMEEHPGQHQTGPLILLRTRPLGAAGS
jgi:4-amino-4-deoxy-L-arabinose transferase-like glycosyltransferase